MEDSDRTSETTEQFGEDPAREPASSGYPEEQPAGTEGAEGGADRSGNPKIADRDSPEGASGEGSQSTGHPEGAG